MKLLDTLKTAMGRTRPTVIYVKRLDGSIWFTRDIQPTRHLESVAAFQASEITLLSRHGRATTTVFLEDGTPLYWHYIPPHVQRIHRDPAMVPTVGPELWRGLAWAFGLLLAGFLLIWGFIELGFAILIPAAKQVGWWI